MVHLLSDGLMTLFYRQRQQACLLCGHAGAGISEYRRGADFSSGLPWREILSFATAMVLTTIAGHLVGGALRLSDPRKAAFVQGALRGNFAIIGLAVLVQILGPEWVPAGSVILVSASLCFLSLTAILTILKVSGFT